MHHFPYTMWLVMCEGWAAACARLCGPGGNVPLRRRGTLAALKTSWSNRWSPFRRRRKFGCSVCVNISYIHIIWCYEWGAELPDRDSLSVASASVAVILDSASRAHVADLVDVAMSLFWWWCRTFRTSLVHVHMSHQWATRRDVSDGKNVGERCKRRGGNGVRVCSEALRRGGS